MHYCSRGGDFTSFLTSLNMADFATSSITVESFIRGYHVYKDVADWDPQLQEERVLKREPNNKKARGGGGTPI